jgi:hypothetical protein
VAQQLPTHRLAKVIFTPDPPILLDFKQEIQIFVTFEVTKIVQIDRRYEVKMAL